ncbi:MAG: hypothetical protein BWY21_02069 [Parcubacteria group bacterium ADurb.Bin216]|nr:MAG: hypothetical protein BWY21_02069 [Parcubacteria group bacterium ADurb.Bin216]
MEETIDPKKELIEVKTGDIIDSFTIQELEEQIARIDGQIDNIKTSSEAEIKSLEEEKISYREKILSNAYKGYKLPDFTFIDNQPKE